MGHQEDILIYPENYITIKLKLLVLQSEVKMRVFCGYKIKDGCIAQIGRLLFTSKKFCDD
jgi:hypothetical protein